MQKSYWAIRNNCQNNRKKVTEQSEKATEQSETTARAIGKGTEQSEKVKSKRKRLLEQSEKGTEQSENGTE